MQAGLQGADGWPHQQAAPGLSAAAPGLHALTRDTGELCEVFLTINAVFHMFLSPINLNKYSAISDKIVWMVYTHWDCFAILNNILTSSFCWAPTYKYHLYLSTISTISTISTYLLTVGSMRAWWTPQGDLCWHTRYPRTPHPPEGGILQLCWGHIIIFS